MKTDATELETCHYKVTVEIPADEVDAAFDKAYKDAASHASIKGFRKGKVPRRILERKYGEDVTREVTGKLMQEGFTQAMQEAELTPLADPDIDFSQYQAAPHEALNFEGTVDVRPKFDLPLYKGIKLTETTMPVPEEDIEKQYDQMREAFATFEPVDDGLQEGDICECDLTVIVGDEELMNLTDCRVASDSGKVVGIDCENLAKDLAGVKAGEDRALTGSIPETYHREEVRGKEAAIKITAKKIERPALPELNEEFAKRMGFDTMDAIRERIVSNLEEEKRVESSQAMEKQAVDKLLESATFDLPTAFIKRQVDSRVAHQTRLLAPDGGELDDEKKEKLEEFTKQITEETESSTKRMILFDSIAEAEKIEVTQQDVEQHIGRLAQAYRTTPDEMLKRIQQLNAFPAIAQEIRDIKVTQFVIENADVTKEETTA